MPCCTVGFTTPQGVRYWHVTAGATLFAACATALDWFARDFWRGPKPGEHTVASYLPCSGKQSDSMASIAHITSLVSKSGIARFYERANQTDRLAAGREPPVGWLRHRRGRLAK